MTGTENVQRFHPNVKEVAQALIKRFDSPDLGNKRNPFNELLYIILSSKTPPDRYQEVYKALKRAYPRADDFIAADPAEVARVINRAGLQNRKAHAIVAIARKLQKEFGRVTLAPLKQMTDEEAERFLESLPEVSKKTARCVSMYALDRAVFPVDAHCFRISKRLGWVSTEMSLTPRAADELQQGVPERLRKDLHIGMVILGRNYCLVRGPKCEDCPLMQLCPTGSQPDKAS